MLYLLLFKNARAVVERLASTMACLYLIIIVAAGKVKMG
jgi:hypothetical protein